MLQNIPNQHMLFFSTGLLETDCETLAIRRCVFVDFSAFSFIGSFLFRCKIYGRRVFIWIMQGDLVRFGIVSLLVFAALWNTQKACLHPLWSYFGSSLPDYHWFCLFATTHIRFTLRDFSPDFHSLRDFVEIIVKFVCKYTVCTNIYKFLFSVTKD